jgi:5-methylcytosine-specific restriction endonuclease McrA
MPISPENRHRYPPDWKAIRERILERAGNRCEGTPQFPGCRARNRKPHPETGSKVALTIAHYPNPDPADAAPDNLIALCQRCHLALDRKQHVENARRTRERKRGQPRLPGLEDL